MLNLYMTILLSNSYYMWKTWINLKIFIVVFTKNQKLYTFFRQQRYSIVGRIHDLVLALVMIGHQQHIQNLISLQIITP